LKLELLVKTVLGLETVLEPEMPEGTEAEQGNKYSALHPWNESVVTCEKKDRARFVDHWSLLKTVAYAVPFHPSRNPLAL
jgi:hypothetical protein